MKMCPKCGTPNLDDAAFCENCGSPLTNTAPVPVNQAKQPPAAKPPVYNQAPPAYNQAPPAYNQGAPAQKQGVNKTAIIIVAIVAFAVIAASVSAVIIFKGKNSSNEVVTSTTASTTEATTAEEITESTTETTTQTTTEKTTEATTKKKKPKKVTTTAEYYEDEYLYPSDSEYISYAELDYMSKDEVRRILNEMYARHGARFNQKKNIQYFNSQSWYTPTCSMEEAEKHFNKYERANRDTIVEYEKPMGWR